MKVFTAITTIIITPFVLLSSLNANAQSLVEIATPLLTFSPSSVTICQGDTVRWVVSDGIHQINGTAATFPNNPDTFSSGPIGVGDVLVHVFTEPGVYNYHCDVHFAMGMFGTITVTPAADASWSYPTYEVCYSDSSLFASVQGSTGGLFSATPIGLDLNAATGFIDLASTAAGTYDITYSVGGTCPASFTHTVSIQSDNGADFNYTDTTFCANGPDLVPVVFTGISGVFGSQQPGLVIDSITGIINVSATPPGPYAVDHEIGGTCPDTATTNILIEALTAEISEVGNTLAANITDANYQWIDCNSMTAIATATRQSFIPPGPGSYAVAITVGVCTDTSDCHLIFPVGIESGAAPFGISVFPNPADNAVRVTLQHASGQVRARLLNTLGQEVRSFMISGTATTLHLDVPPGLYLLEAQDAQGTLQTIKLLKR